MTTPLISKTPAESIQSLGGKARAEALTPAERSEIAKKAADARHSLPKASHTAPLRIGDVVLECHVLEDGTRLLSRIGFLRAIGRTGKAKGGRAYDDEFGLPVFLTAKNLTPFITSDLLENSRPIRFYPVGVKTPAMGYRAELLPQTCAVFLDAHYARATSRMQADIVTQCKILHQGFAVVGINALIDEATGYQEVRDRLALQKILDRYLTDEWAKWSKTFPDDFYFQLFRLKRVVLPNAGKGKRPSYVGHWTNDIVYSRLAPGVVKALREKNPRLESGARARKHHQHLTRDYGHPALRDLISNEIFLMRTCSDWNEFKRKLDLAAPKYGDTLSLNLD
ncbi:MAG: hypothetical protein KJ072_15745 [Verrucomicrobia bacterium]|nr:hypothetical protein [Verrucomicrobiota bacterium]